MTLSINTVNVPLIPATPQEWFSWLSQEETKTVAAYRNKPTLLIADYHRERAVTRDYEGREILELLQNANDQAAEAHLRGRVAIELLPEGLVVANTGIPFSTAGVESLQTSHLSPKRSKKRQIIGNKGLGFRSVLNWSRVPIVLSGSLRLAYSLSHARSRLHHLIETSVELRSIVRQEQRGGDDLVLPLLPFPFYTEDGDLSSGLLDRQAKVIFDRCQVLINAGYDTAIGMPFDLPQAHEAALAQVNELRPEILLFTQHLKELVFRRDREAELKWKVDKSDDLTRVLCNGEPLGEWRVHRMSEALPAEATESDQGDNSDYEIVVAVPATENRAPSPLFSYFPTNINVPLPVVCHATLELEQNRKHVQQGRRSNEFVLGRLADFLADIAEKIAAEPANDPWTGCSLLMPTGDFPGDLMRVCFPKRLTKATQSRAVVPTLRGSPIRADEARLIAGANASWLPPSLFAEVAPIRCSEEFWFLRSLGVSQLEPAELKRRILGHSGLTPDTRVAFIDGLLRYQISQEAFTSALFLDAADEPVADGMRVFIAPSGCEVPKLPDWLDLRFLNEGMRSQLATRLGTRDNRELQQRLGGFGLLEYSLASVISALVAGANRAIKAAPDYAATFERDLLMTIFRLYCAEGQTSKRPEYPEKSPIRLRNQRNESVAANTLYLGRGFGTQGEIVQALYEPCAREKLIVPPDSLGLTQDKEILKGFLLWIGVSEWPRDTLVDNVDSAYRDYVLSIITFPALFGEYSFKARGKVPRPSIKKVKSIDGMEIIVEQADPHAISAWLALDARVPSWQRSAKEHAELSARPGQTSLDRIFQGELPNYIRWMLETRPWLLLPSGGRVSPRDCVIGERAADELFPRPAMPSDTELARYGVRQSDLVEGWRRAGVLTSLAYLERDEIYAKLLELPRRSPDGKLARPLYQWLLEASDMAIGVSGRNYREFLANGKMWGRFGNTESYFPVTELHHADAEGLPEVLLQRLKIVDLRKRVGADKVERLFGVKPIDRAGIRQKVIGHLSAVGSANANTDFQAAKPYLHQLRSSQASHMTNLQVLKEIQLEVCSELRAAIAYEEEAFEYDVPVWGWLIENKTLFVRADPADPINLSLDLVADAIGEALASIFRIGDGGDFARMLLCKDRDRQKLLRKMRGESVIEEIESLKAVFAAFQADKLLEARFPITEPPMVSANLNTPTVQTPANVEPTSPVVTQQPTPENPLQITEEHHILSPPPNKQKIRVTTITTPTQPTTVMRRVTDGDFCERKAVEFEEAIDPPRFPLLVSQVVGADAARCDILSFSTREARESFQIGSTRDMGLVTRFIEVKGRSNAVGAIELKGNELSAAERYGECYYLYRLYETDRGDFVLTILQNPLKHKDALQPAVYVDLNRAAATQQFSLIGGITTSQEL